jgi:hypothetical protein
MRKSLLVLILAAAGCLSVPTQENLQTRRSELAAAKVRLAAVQSIDSPDYERLLGEVTLAEIRLEEAKAQAVQERIQSGLKGAEFGTSIIGTPLTILFPALGPLFSAAVGLIALFRKGNPDAKV